MTHEDWITALHRKVVPPGRGSSPERSVLFLRPRLDDLPDDWFTEDAIDAVFLKLRSLNSADRVRAALRDFHAAREASTRVASRFIPQPETDWVGRAEFLRRDWDDAAGIRDKVRHHHADHWALRRLALLVGQWAPQHLSLLPPAILATVSASSWEFAGLLKRIELGDFVPPARTTHEQIDAIADDPEPRPRYLTPEQLDAINPLPNGRKRAVPPT